MMRVVVSALIVVLAWWVAPARAVNPNEVLDDPVLEERARNISKGLRCLVCQNQSIDDSDAGLARDLRVLVRERLTAGDSDTQTIDYIVARYGDFVLLKPPFKATTLILWVGPGVVGVLAALWAFVFLRRNRQRLVRSPAAAAPLDDDEKQRLAELLKDGQP